MRMTRLLAAALAASTIAGGAFAADLPSRKAPAPMVYAPPPVFTWTGLYVGVNGGGWFDNSSMTYGFASGNLGGGGGLVGGTVGYNMQVGNGVVAGVEADLDYRTKANVTPPYGLATNSSDGYLGTARARLGYGMDRALFYVTGGLAFGTPVTPGSINAPAFGLYGVQASTPGASIGWTAGAGLEYALTNNWSVKGEYLYAALGTKSISYNTMALPAVIGDRTGEHTARIGLNYRFNMGGGGGYAKY